MTAAARETELERLLTNLELAVVNYRRARNEGSIRVLDATLTEIRKFRAGGVDPAAMNEATGPAFAEASPVRAAELTGRAGYRDTD